MLVLATVMCRFHDAHQQVEGNMGNSSSKCAATSRMAVSRTKLDVALVADLIGGLASLLRLVPQLLQEQRTSFVSLYLPTMASHHGSHKPLSSR